MGHYIFLSIFKIGTLIFGIQQVVDNMIRFVSFVSLILELADLL